MILLKMININKTLKSSQYYSASDRVNGGDISLSRSWFCRMRGLDYMVWLVSIKTRLFLEILMLQRQAVTKTKSWALNCFSICEKREFPNCLFKQNHHLRSSGQISKRQYTKVKHALYMENVIAIHYSTPCLKQFLAVYS